MSTALTVVPPQAIAGLTPTSIDEATTLATMLSKSVLVPEHFRGKPSDVFMAVSYGLELGMPPVTSLMSIAVIKGKPALYAHAMVALVLDSGKCEYFRRVESSSRHAIYETKRRGNPEPLRYEFNEAMAKAAGLLGGMFSKYSQQMYEARAKAYLAKDCYPDVLHGLSSYEETESEAPVAARSVVDEFSQPAPMAKPVAVAVPVEVIEAEVVEEPAPIDVESDLVDEPNLIDQMLGTKSMEELDGLLPQLRTLKGAERDTAKAIYKQQRDTLQAAK